MIVGLNLLPLNNEFGTGAFRYIQMLWQEMGRYSLQNCKFIVYKQKCISEAYLNIPASLDVEYVDMPNVGNKVRRFFFEQTRFYHYIKPCDVFFCYCSSIPFFLKTKKIYTLHDVYFFTERERYPLIQRTWLKLVTRWYIKACDHVLTVSQYSKKEIIKYYHVPETKLTITYNFILQRAQTTTTPLPQSITKPYFLFVGSIQPGKNIERMAEAFRLFNHDNDYQLVVCGGGSYNGNEILQHIAQYPNVVCLGYQPRDVVECLFEHCVATVLISLCEGFGIPPLEGFGYGKPAIVSNRTSLPEVVGQAGICVNPLDIQAIAQAYKEIEQNGSVYAQHCTTQLAKFSPQDATQTFMNILGINYKEQQ